MTPTISLANSKVINTTAKALDKKFKVTSKLDKAAKNLLPKDYHKEAAFLVMTTKVIIDKKVTFTWSF